MRIMSDGGNNIVCVPMHILTERKGGGYVPLGLQLLL